MSCFYISGVNNANALALNKQIVKLLKDFLMKKVMVVMMLILFGVTNGYSQFSFGVSPGLVLNEAYFGYKMGDLVPYIGVQYLSAGLSLDESGQRIDGGTVVNYTEENELSGSIFMPFLGAKYFLIHEKDLKGYLNASIYKPLISADESAAGEAKEYIDDVVDNISIWGIQIGVGSEYFLAKSFSIGGEFGFRMLFGSYTETDTYTDYLPPDYDEPVELTTDYEWGAGLNALYAKFTLNFYFGQD